MFGAGAANGGGAAGGMEGPVAIGGKVVEDEDQLTTFAGGLPEGEGRLGGAWERGTGRKTPRTAAGNGV